MSVEERNAYRAKLKSLQLSTGAANSKPRREMGQRLERIAHGMEYESGQAAKAEQDKQIAKMIKDSPPDWFAQEAGVATEEYNGDS